MDETRIPRSVLVLISETRPRGTPINRWKGEVRVDGRIFGGEEWQEKEYNTDEWKKLLTTKSNRRILVMAME
jgi:hypothetical protein